jgi:polysaccharide biosynthesis transport protein
MPDETDNLIERAAALLRHPAASRQDNAAGGADAPPRGHAGRATRPAADHFDSGHQGRLLSLDAAVQPIPAPIVEPEEMRLRHLLRAASLHKSALIGSALLLMVAATAAIFAITPQYAAVAVVAIGNRAPSVATRIESDIDGNVVQSSPDAATLHTQVDTQVDYLYSRPVAERAMDALDLWNKSEFDRSSGRRGGPVDRVSGWVRSALTPVRQLRAWLSGGKVAPDAQASELARRNAAIGIFLKKLKVEAKPESQIITVQFEDPDPQLAAAAANAVADQYIARQIEAASGSAQRATAGLQQAVAALRQRVAQSDQAYEQYRGAFEARNGRELLNTQTAEATKELTAAEIERQVIEARLTALRGVGGGNPSTEATSEITQSRVMQDLHEQAAVLQGRLAELSVSLGDANPQIQQVRAAIARVNGEMRSEVARQNAALESELRVAAAREASLRQSLAANRTQSSQSSGGQAKLDALQVEAESNRAVLNAFLTRLHEADTSAKLLQPADAEIVQRASPSQSPAYPNVKLLLAAAAVGSTMAGFGVALALERTAPTFRSSEEIENETGVRTLGLVPLIDNPDAPPEEALAAPASFYGEAVRALYMTLLLRQNLKMLVVTSARPGDGKTTLAASLALVAATAGRKVLLIDADLCTAGASRIFRVNEHEGLAELIADKRPFSDVIGTAHSNPNFHFLAAGTPGKVLAARAGLESVVGLFRRLREEYDLIVIDSPPVLAVADAMAVAAQADAVLFAVRWGSTPRAAVKLGLKRLHASARGASVGAVLTMVDAREHSRFGYADSAFYTKDLVGYYGSSANRA